MATWFSDLFSSSDNSEELFKSFNILQINPNEGI